MKKLTSMILAIAVVFFFTCGSAMATYINPDGGGSEISLQTVLNNITVGGDSDVDAADADNDAISDDFDSYWKQTGSGGSSATMIIELAGYKNDTTMGIYDGVNTVQLFSGAQGAGDQAHLSIKSDGRVFVNLAYTGVDFDSNHFGFYITTPNDTFYSDTALNEDNFDHMVAFQGNDTQDVKLHPDLNAGLWTDNEFILAFEDKLGGGDKDYQDLVLMVESVEPVPEPTTLILFGSGLLGLCAYARKRRKN